MLGFVFGVGVVITAMFGAFEQGQANPQADNLFDSKSIAVQADTKVYGVDEIK